MLKVDEGTLMNRSIYEEKQVGLTENLLTVGSFSNAAVPGSRLKI